MLTSSKGNFDVKRLHSIDVTNAVAPCGTALTEDQVLLLKRYTKNVTLVYYGDQAGRAAIDKYGELLVKNQFNVMVLQMPDGQDPDTLFLDYKAFESYAEENRPTDYIIYRVLKEMKRCENPSYKSESSLQKITCTISNEGSYTWRTMSRSMNMPKCTFACLVQMPRLHSASTLPPFSGISSFIGLDVFRF